VGGLIAVLMTSSLVWILNDRSVWPWDRAWYGEVTLDLGQARHGGLLAWGAAALHAIGAKPPLLVWIAQFFVPLSRFTGDVESSLLLQGPLEGEQENTRISSPRRCDFCRLGRKIVD